MSNEDIVEEFTPQDTKDIQMKSVCAFMEHFNYLLHIDGKFYSNTFWDWEKGKREDPYFQGCEVIRMNTAVDLHNTPWVPCHSDPAIYRLHSGSAKLSSLDKIPVFSADAYALNKAVASKIVKQVFLQGTKHGRTVCHKHLVKFVCPSYQYMFLECSQEVHA